MVQSCPVGNANVISLIKKRPKVINRKTFHLFQRPTYSAARDDVFVSYTVSDAAPAGANSRFSVLITLLSARQDRARFLTWRPFLQYVFCTVKIDPLPEERAEFSSSAQPEKN
jgi:hypothetical protein